jgi:hypothetical protein
MEDKFKFLDLKQNITKLKRDLPRVLANDAQNYFVKSWADQGFDGQKWQDVKRHDKETSEYKYPKALRRRKLSSPILVGVYKGRSGGTLRRAVSRSIRSATFTSIRLVVDLPYAAAQNEGNPGKDLPARPYMGQSKVLTRQQREKIKQYMDGLWK